MLFLKLNFRYFLISKQFKQIGHPVNYYPILMRNAKVGLCVLLLIIPFCLSAYIISGSAIRVFLFSYSAVYFVMSVSVVASANAGLVLRLNSIVDIIKFEMEQEKLRNKIKFLEDEKASRAKVGSISEIYQKILDICDSRNRCYGAQLMLDFGFMFFYTLFTCFTAYTDFINDHKLADGTIVSSIFCVYYNAFLATVIFTCSKVVQTVSLEVSEITRKVPIY